MMSNALAVHDTGAFELDGNAASSTALPAPPDDWDRVCHQVLGGDCSTTFNTNGASAVDWVSEPNLNASVFTGGGSKDPQDISNWLWKDGSAPDKDNLLHSFAARYPNTSEGDVLFFGSDRLDNSGDAQQGFWFFQNSISTNGATGGSGTKFTGVHRNGDVLVVTDFSIGGTTSTITVYKWDTTCSKTTGTTAGTCGDANLRILGTSTNAKCTSAAANDQFCGVVNANTITMPWSFTDKSGTPNNQALNGEFFEGGLNLTKLGLAGECFTSVASETRSSTSTTATLKDFVLGQFGGCGSSLTTQSSPSGSTSIGTGSVSASDTADVTVTGVANWTGTVQFHLHGPIGATNEVSTDIGGPVDVSNGNTHVSSATATVTAAGDYCWSAHFHATSPASGIPDADDNGVNECFTVTPVTPQLGTSAGAGPVELGNPITDTATLGGTANEPGTPAINPTTAGGPAGGTITFTAYGPNNCTTAAFTTTRTVNGDGTYGPVSFTPTAVGTYHWVASYGGDPPNTNAASHNADCSDTGEDVTVRDTTAATSAQTWLPNDTGSITSAGGAPLNGTLSIQLYTEDNCGATSGSAVNGQLYTKTLTNATSPATLTTNNTSFSVTTSAAVSWKVTFTSTEPNVDGSTHCEHTALTIVN